MSVSSLKNKVKSLQSEVERLTRELERESKKEISANAKIQMTEKSINKNTSTAMLKSKLQTIDSEKKKALDSQKKQSDINSKIMKKRNELQKAQGDLQIEMAKEQDKTLQAQGKVIEQQRQIIENLVKQDKTIENEVDENKEYDFFISHASEDKEEIAEPLAQALINMGAVVWYDKFTLSIGDSLRKSIDLGLANSRYGIVILSKPYFKKFWTGEELNGLFAKQESGKKVILPVWHNISKDEVKRNSPMLADMLAFKSADFTIDELAEEFMKLVQ